MDENGRTVFAAVSSGLEAFLMRIPGSYVEVKGAGIRGGDLQPELMR